MRERRSVTKSEAAALLLILGGIALRLWLFAANRSLWFDEGELAQSIVTRSFWQQAEPLSNGLNGAVAPILFLFSEKALIGVLGNHDYILRLLPFLAGILALPLMWQAARDYLGAPAALIALGLFAVSERLVNYASELKQYSLDAAVALLVLVVAFRCLRAETRSRGAWVALLVLGTLGTWLSFPLLFILCGVGLSLGLDLAIRKDRQGLRWFAGMVLAWGASLLADYLILLRPVAGNASLTNYWQAYFMPMPPWRNLGWFAFAWRRLLADPAGLSQTLAATVLIAVGAVSLLRRHWQSALLVLVPLPVVLLASGLGRYPFGGRLLLFATPIVYLLVAAGIERTDLVLSALAGRLAHTRAQAVESPAWLAHAVALVLAALLLCHPVTETMHRVANPLSEHTKPLLAFLERNRDPQDPIYVSFGAVWAFAYYAPQYELDRGEIEVGPFSDRDAEPLLRKVDELIGQPRVWLLFSHKFYRATVDEEEAVVSHLDAIGSRLRHVTAPGASLYLYDLSEKPESAPDETE